MLGQKGRNKRLGDSRPVQDNNVYRRPFLYAAQGQDCFRGKKNSRLSFVQERGKVMEDHHFHLGINREKWLWRYTTLKGSADGWTDYAKKKVLLNKRSKNRTRLELELHEGLHSTLGPTISEEAVTSAASDLAKILWSLGYRLQNKDQK